MNKQQAATPQSLGTRARDSHRQGRFDEALVYCDRALALQPDYFEAQYHRGILLWEMKRDEEALASLELTIALRPDHAATWNNRGNVLRRLRRYDEALASFENALTLKPDFANAIYNRANVLLQDLGRANEALAGYEQAVALKPDFAEAWNNRGNALCGLGRMAESVASFDKALALRPDFAAALNCRGQVQFESNHIQEGIASFMRAAQLVYGSGQSPPDGPSPPYKLRHDREQQDYLASIKVRQSIAAGARVAGPAVLPGNSAAADQWRTKKPQIAVIDNLLSAEALEGLRRFCWEEPVWRASYHNGYLGAFPAHGFACPLLGQVAEELRGAFPDILCAHPLLYMWGFKYDSQLTGISIHADESAVNVNFWLTPDEANLDPQSGGLVLWDVAAPLDWDFDKFNRNTPAIRDFLARAGAKSVTVPYRANRAVIFDSDLFHETDTIRFKEGYLNRRINVTMLFGRRGLGQL
jgi:tetratricopeptide (TPR) repeat protein